MQTSLQGSNTETRLLLGAHTLSSSGRWCAAMLGVLLSMQLSCKDGGTPPVENNGPDAPECLSDRSPIDTTRVYLFPLSRDTLTIYPKAIFARFYPWVSDTSLIVALAARHNLRLLRNLFMLDGQLAGVFCVTDGRRAEYHFTPWGKQPWNNFGADSLVEHCFGIFDSGYHIPYGTIVFRFVDGIPSSTIDSLLVANGLRFLYTRPDYPTGELFTTLVTPRAVNNPLDLACKLQSLLFVRYINAEIASAMSPVRCE